MDRIKSHQELVKEALKKSETRKAYDALEEEFVLLKEMVLARQRAGKTQEEVAESMDTSTSVIGRLETGGGKSHHSPTVATLRKYARAIGCEISIKFIPKRKPPRKKTANGN